MNRTIDTRERITARVPKELYDRLKKAAQIYGSTLNSFIVQLALKEADRIIENYNYQVFSLTNLEDATWLKEKLEEPALANDNLNQALRSYKEFINDQHSNSKLRRP